MNPEQGKILLVEDNPSDIQLILHEFQKEGIAPGVHVVFDGEEALTYLLHSSDRQRPEFIILDLKLPKINGLEVLEQIRSEPTLQRIPVVVFTSSSEENDLHKSRKFGIGRYIVKPVNHEEFIKALGKIIQFWRMHTGNK